MKEKQLDFTLEDIAKNTLWSLSTVRTYVGKKWRPFLIQEGQKLRIETSAFVYSEDEYLRMMSQVNKYSSDPFKPDLPSEVEELVVKAKEAATLAVDIYNRPITSFRSHGFTVMMIIAWTALLHAIFECNEVDYFYYNKDGTPEIIDGDSKAWDLSQCVGKFTGISQAAKDNIRLFILLRNKIEHRFAPAIDLDICGECQALLLNFEDLMTSTFGTFYSLNSTLSIPLQVITCKPAWQADARRQLQSRHYNELRTFIDAYRNSLSKDIYSDSAYSFRVYLTPKTANRLSSSDTAIEFVRYDAAQPDRFSEIERNIVLIKEKHVQVANQGFFKPTKVCKLVSARIGRKITVSMHTKAWKYYGVREPGCQPYGCKTIYCQYDEPHKDYIYTQAWVDFLSARLANEEEYKRVASFR